VFVSHSHEDADFGHRLVADLREHLGPTIEVWYDNSGGLRVGDNWWETIVTKLAMCDLFLLIMSPAAQQSRAVSAELDMAWTRRLQGKTRILPILYMACDARLDLTTLQFVSFLSPKTYDRGLGELVAALIPYTLTDASGSDQRAGSRMEFETQLYPALPGKVLPHVVPTLLMMSIAGTFPTRQVAIAGRALSIGREADNDLVLPDPAVSRRHLQLERMSTGWWLESRTEAGVVYVNGEQCIRAHLSTGDQVVIGGTVLRFELPDPLPDSNHVLIGAAATIHTSATPSQLSIDCAQCHFVAPLRQPIITIGRRPDQGVVIPSPIVAGAHATLRRISGSAYRVEGIVGKHGLLLQNQSTLNRTLQSGDVLVMGVTTHAGPSVTLTYASL
jgi:pSer/pThr/pTyr-binding forkhead associated (FHA) protein